MAGLPLHLGAVSVVRVSPNAFDLVELCPCSEFTPGARKLSEVPEHFPVLKVAQDIQRIRRVPPREKIAHSHQLGTPAGAEL